MDDSVVTDVSGRFAYVVGRFNRRLIAARGELSYGLLSALSTVAKQGPIRFADLAQIELVSAPSITRLVAELENRGLVKRSADPIDGRASLIVVTEKGSAAILDARAARAKVVYDLLSSLTAEQVAAVENALPVLEGLID
jgi:DNA-binding MarR family transcriptional regulator